MSTATIARVRGVIAASTAAGSRFSVDASTSANTGAAPSRMKQFAVATNEIGDVITSSPGPSPSPWQSRCSPAVPLVTATACGAPTRSAKSSSKRSIAGPIERRPGAQHLEDELLLALPDVRLRERNPPDGGAHASAGARSGWRRTRATAPSARRRRERCRGTPSGASASPARAGRSRGRRPTGSASPRRPCRP